jgi:hypothetical protein
MTRHFSYAFLAAVCLCILSGCGDKSTLNCDSCKASLPKPEALVGVWVGFDDGDKFCRLDLRADSKGYFTRVARLDSDFRESGVEAYRIANWALDRWKISVNLIPVTTNAEAIYLRGNCGSSISLEFGSTNAWKRGVVLYSESLFNEANQETRDKISKLDKR